MQDAVFEPLSQNRWPPTTWHTLLGAIFRPEHLPFFPAKIFRLNSHNQYIDCFFPITCEHFCGGQQILGRHLHEIIPHDTRRTIHKAMKNAQKQRSPAQTLITLPTRQRGEIKVHVTFLSLLSGDLLVFATDYHRDGTPRVPMHEWNPEVQRFKKALWPQDCAPPPARPEGWASAQ